MSEALGNLLSVISSRVSDHTHDGTVTLADAIHHSHDGHGYWGAPSSTVDWCEVNYEYTDYIAEFFNTISSLSMVFSGLLGVWMHYKDLEARFVWVFASVALVGIGSAAFHGTLLISMQMLDELPMIYTSLLLAYCAIQNEYVKPRFYPAFPIALFVHGVITTLLVASPVLAPAYASPLLQFICFHVSFGLLEIFLFSQTTRFWYEEKNLRMKRIHEVGVFFWTLGIAFWVLDYVGCESLWEGQESWRRMFLSWTINLSDYTWMNNEGVTRTLTAPNPQFHAWWHVCASTGLYLMTLFVAQKRCLILGQKADVLFYCGFPYVRVEPKIEATKKTLAQAVKTPTQARKRVSKSPSKPGQDSSDESVPTPFKAQKGSNNEQGSRKMR